MSRNPRTKTHMENVQIAPSSSHGDTAGDVALEVIAIDSDVLGFPTSKFAVTEAGGISAAGNTAIAGTITNSVTGDPVVYTCRHRVTAAEINAGHALVAVPAGLKGRLVDVKAIPYGGAVGGLTTLDLTDGTNKLVTWAQTNLTENSVNTTVTTGATVLAAGASFAALAAGADFTLSKTGNNATTATGVDIILSYTLEV